MSLLKIGTVAAALVLLSACGFTPMYAAPDMAAHVDGAKDGTGAPLSLAQALNAIAVEPIPERNGQILRNYLLDRLNRGGRPDVPLYRLSIALATPSSRSGIQQDDSATRQQLRLSATYRLHEIGTDRVLSSGVARVTVGFPVLVDEYATLIAERDAMDKGLQDLARDLEMRLGAYLRSKPADGTLSPTGTAPVPSPTTSFPVQPDPNRPPTQSY